MRLISLIIVALLASACTLTTQPATPTALPTQPATEEIASTAEASLTPLPGIAITPGATRTPFGNSAPTTQPIAPTSGFPTPASGEGADITSPASGASVSGMPLYVSGVVHNLPEDRFTLQVFDPAGQALTGAQTITLSNPNHVADVPWSASLTVNSYTGAAQIRVMARTTGGTDAVIGSVDVTITTGSANPVQPSSGGASATINSPANGGSASGNPITVTGSAGGIPDNQFTLLLLDGGGTVLSSQLISLTGAEQNIVPWSATLGTGGYHGQAEIRAIVISGGQQVTLASARVNLQ